jgi:hypothetical protein
MLGPRTLPLEAILEHPLASTHVAGPAAGEPLPPSR